MSRHRIRLGLSIALLTAPFVLAHAATPPAPDVIAPEALPALQAVWSDSTLPKATSGGFSAAPMPDADADAPIAVAEDPDPKVRPAFYGHKKQFRGDGFAYGSTAQDVQDRAIKPAPGIALNVPLD